MINISIPQIPVPKGAPATFYRKLFIAFPASMIYGNLNFKNMDYGQRHDFVNKIIRDVFIDFELELKDASDEVFTLDTLFYKIKNGTETIIYWLRKTADDLIALAFYMDFYISNKYEPSKLDIDCIGKLLNCKSAFKELFKEHLEFLERLNNVSNTYKHSFIHTDILNHIGLNEPTVVALNLKYNNSQNSPKIYNYSLKQMVISYSKFFEETEILLRVYSAKMLMPGFIKMDGDITKEKDNV